MGKLLYVTKSGAQTSKHLLHLNPNGDAIKCSPMVTFGWIISTFVFMMIKQTNEFMYCNTSKATTFEGTHSGTSEHMHLYSTIVSVEVNNRTLSLTPFTCFQLSLKNSLQLVKEMLHPLKTSVKKRDFTRILLNVQPAIAASDTNCSNERFLDRTVFNGTPWRVLTFSIEINLLNEQTPNEDQRRLCRWSDELGWKDQDHSWKTTARKGRKLKYDPYQIRVVIMSNDDYWFPQ